MKMIVDDLDLELMRKPLRNKPKVFLIFTRDIQVVLIYMSAKPNDVERMLNDAIALRERFESKLTKRGGQNDKRGNSGTKRRVGREIRPKIGGMIRNVRNNIQELPRKENGMCNHGKFKTNKAGR